MAKNYPGCYIVDFHLHPEISEFEYYETNQSISLLKGLLVGQYQFAGTLSAKIQHSALKQVHQCQLSKLYSNSEVYIKF